MRIKLIMKVRGKDYEYPAGAEIEDMPDKEAADLIAMGAAAEIPAPEKVKAKGNK